MTIWSAGVSLRDLAVGPGSDGFGAMGGQSLEASSRPGRLHGLDSGPTAVYEGFWVGAGRSRRALNERLDGISQRSVSIEGKCRRKSWSCRNRSTDFSGVWRSQPTGS